MKDSRIGQSLWSLWDGVGYDEQLINSIVYYTEEHVDVDHEVVRKALASAIQREGIVYSLSQGFQAIDAGVVSHKWIKSFEEELYLEVYDDEVADSVPATFVEVPDLV